MSSFRNFGSGGIPILIQSSILAGSRMLCDFQSNAVVFLGGFSSVASTSTY